MRKRFFLTVTSAIGLIALLLPVNAHSPRDISAPYVAADAQMTGAAAQTKLDATKAALRDLWIGHVFWVRNVVVAGLVGDANAQNSAETQVVSNARAIAASIEPFYGAKAKSQMFTLLGSHYGAVKAYLDATIANDASMQSAANAAMLKNASDIASFLSGANTHLPQDTVEGLLQVHGGHHITQIQQLQGKKYSDEATTWLEMTQHMYVIADATANALALQFPEHF